MTDRRTLLKILAAAGASAFLPAIPARASTGVIAILEDELASGRACGSEAAAIRATLSRIGRTPSPGAGRTVVVDLPSQHLGAYVDGQLEFESRVVVGDPSWETPDLDTEVSMVRFNPTWTVPESILRARSWRDRLASEPGYFERLNFLVELRGQMVSPSEASSSASSVGRFVQQPGPGNALGKVKLGLKAGGAIYLHDTNDPAAFDEGGRALSHGCIRVERAVELAAWVLGMSDYEAEGLVDADDRKDRNGFAPVRVVTTYFTAWPDAYGGVAYYPDIYGRDGGPADCGVGLAPAWGGSEYDQQSFESAGNVPSDVIIYGN